MRTWVSAECRIYLQEIARRRIDLESEIQRIGRLLHLYGPTDLAEGMKRDLAARTFGVRYVRALIDQSRFARALGEPPEPIVTGNTTADEIVVEPHSLETYDALFQTPKPPAPPKPPPPIGDG